MPERILIVDDDLDTLRLVGLMLERQGYEIIVATNGEQALDMAKKHEPGLILLDIMMPDMDGYEVTRRLREKLETSVVPIIMFTAKGQVDDKITGLEAGADAYLTKPTQPRELFAQVKTMLSRAKKTQDLVSSTLERGHVIGVIGAKGGLGVSSLVVNLAVSIRNHTEKEVVVADLRPGQSSLSIDLGYPHPEGISKLLKSPPTQIKRRDVEVELINHLSGIKLLLASSQPVDGKYANEVDSFDAIVRHLPFIADFVVLDLGNGLTPVTTKLVDFCDEVHVVLEPVPNNINHSRALIRDLFSLGIGEGRITPVLLNRVRSSVQLNWGQVQEKLGRKIAVVITPAPELAYQASVSNSPMVVLQPGSLTAQQYTKLAKIVSGQKS